MTAVIDLVLLGILIICTWCGYKKGILMGLGGILCIIIAVYGGDLLANVFAYDVEPALRPFATGYMESLVSSDDSRVVKRMNWEKRTLSVEDLLREEPERRKDFAKVCYETLGIDDASAERMSEQAVTYVQESGGEMVDGVVHVLCHAVSYVGCFVLGFLLILITLTVIGNLPNLSYKIPYLDLVNDIGGAVIGLVTGLLFCILLVWALKYLGILLGSDTLSTSMFGGRLLRWDPLTQFLNI